MVIGLLAAGLMLLVACCRTENSKTLEPDAPNPSVVKPFDWEKEAEQVITAYVQALTEGDTVALRSCVWRYADQSALKPPTLSLRKARVAAVKAESGFGVGLTIMVFRVRLTDATSSQQQECKEILYFVLVKEKEDGSFKVVGVSKEPINPFEDKRGAVEKAAYEAAEKVVRAYFEALGRRDFTGAATWIHPLWSHRSASPDRAIRKLRLISIEGTVVEQAGRVPLLHYAVTADALYHSPVNQPHPRLNGRNLYFVTLAPVNPLAPTDWRITSIGTGP